MGLPCAVKIRSRLSEESAAESHTAPAASALLRGVPEQLRRSSASLAAPLIGGLNQPRRVKRSPEARLVQSSPEQKFVYLLQLRERENGRQQVEGDRGLIQTGAERCQHPLEHGTLPWWQRWQIVHGVPFGFPVYRVPGLLIHECEKGDGQLRLRGVTAPVSESALLLHQ